MRRRMIQDCCFGVTDLEEVQFFTISLFLLFNFIRGVRNLELESWEVSLVVGITVLLVFHSSFKFR